MRGRRGCVMEHDETENPASLYWMVRAGPIALALVLWLFIKGPFNVTMLGGWPFWLLAMGWIGFLIYLMVGGILCILRRRLTRR